MKLYLRPLRLSQKNCNCGFITTTLNTVLSQGDRLGIQAENPAFDDIHEYSVVENPGAKVLEQEELQQEELEQEELEQEELEHEELEHITPEQVNEAYCQMEN